MIETKFGLMPFLDSYDITPSRRFWDLGVTTKLSLFDRRINLNINHFNDTPESDMTAYRLKLQKVLVGTIDPDFISIENEEDLHPDRVNYIRQLRTAVELFEGRKITNGGFTMSLSYWYYKKTLNKEFWDTCIFDKQGYLDGKFNTMIADTQLELDALILLNVFAVNIHVYIGAMEQVEPNIRMLQYVQQFTGKPIVSNEAGVRKDITLLPYLKIIANTLQMQYMTLYNGDGSPGHAMPISKQQFLSIML